MGLKFWLVAVLLLVAAVECQGKIFIQRIQAVTFYRPTLLLQKYMPSCVAMGTDAGLI